MIPSRGISSLKCSIALVLGTDGRNGLQPYGHLLAPGFPGHQSGIEKGYGKATLFRLCYSSSASTPLAVCSIVLLLLRVLEQLHSQRAMTGVSLNADDLVLCCPSIQDLTAIRDILALFREASGLCTNYSKSSTTTLHCSVVSPGVLPS